MKENFIDWYACYYNANPLRYNNNPQQSNCYANVNNLINYTFSYGSTNLNVPNPDVHFYNININNNYNGERIWNFVFGGETYNAVYSCTFQFDPNCYVPNGIDYKKFKDLNFNQRGENLLEYFQGYVVINGVPVGLSGPGPNPQSANQNDPLLNVINLRWDPKEARLTLFINLGNATVGWAKFFNPPLPKPDPNNFETITVRLEEQFNWQRTKPNTYFVNVWIRDSPSPNELQA